MSLRIVGLVALALVVGPLMGILVDRAVERLRPAPEHRCSHCQHGLGPTSLIPVVGWWQRCPSCERHKGWRYPLLDVAMAAVFVMLGLRFVTDDGAIDLRLVPYLAISAVLLALCAIDVETHLLPNVVVWPSIFASLFVVLVVGGELGDAEGIRAALVGGAVFGGFIGLAHLVNEAGMGRGDVKLALLLGLFVGWAEPGVLVATRLVLYALVLSLVGGGLIGAAYNLIRRRGRAEIPFGPALVAGSLAVIIASPTLVTGGP